VVLAEEVSWKVPGNLPSLPLNLNYALLSTPFYIKSGKFCHTGYSIIGFSSAEGVNLFIRYILFDLETA
jgi:hypothetical protein